MSTYAESIFCTPSDVRARLDTPGKASALTERSATYYAVTISGSSFTTIVSAGLANNAGVSFSTTGAFPSPLQAGVKYYIINNSGLSFEVSASIGGSAITPTGGTGTLSIYASDLETFIAGKIILAEDLVRQDLINYLQQKIPGAISSMLAFKRAQMNAMQSDFSRTLELLDRGTGSWNYPSYGYVTFEGLFYSVNNYQTFGQIPALRINYGSPTSGARGTFAGLAKNGDLLGDILNGIMYINRELDLPPVSPLWQTFLPADGIDYLLNPSELKHAMVSKTIRQMVVDATWRNMAGSEQLVEKGAKNWAIEFWDNEYKRDLERGLSCLDINISGSGLMNDWMRGFTRSEVVICG